MLRRFHSLAGLTAALFLLITATTGALLALDPALQRANALVPARGAVSVADVAEKVLLAYPGTEQIERLPSGAVVVYFTQDGQTAADLINPLTGTRLATYQQSAVFAWLKDLHRAFLWDDKGRAGAGIVALLLSVLCVSGVFLLASRAGGWRQLFAPMRSASNGAISPRLHAELARAAALGLLLSALTGSVMSALRFELLPEAAELEADFPQKVAGTAAAPVGTLPALQQTDLVDLHQLIFPSRTDPQDLYALSTHQGSGYVDQATGQWLSYADYGNAAQLQTFIMELHTGETYWWLGLLFGLAALTVPALVITGFQIWWQRRRAMPHLQGNSAVGQADTIMLVGSESNSTWGFANALCEALKHAGCLVHLAPMDQLANHYVKAERLLILTSTYGDGDAPASASQFLQKLQKLPPTLSLPFAVLAFGDRQFCSFCAFADHVTEALQQRQWPQLLATDYVDRQSAATFEHWGVALGNVLGRPLMLHYTPVLPACHGLMLVERQNYGEAVQAPTCVLRFQSAPPGSTLPVFSAGDLVGILPPGNAAPRFYSLASASTDGVLEICVRQQDNGLCSGFLYNLKFGETAAGFIQKNARFKPAAGKSPILLIGAGTGIAPLVGFIRANTARRPIYLYWGGRLATSDFLYQNELNSYLADQRLSQLHVAFSRGAEPAYVQDKLLQDADQIRTLINGNAQIMLCGGRRMATDVATSLNTILAPIALDVATLKKSGRYLEDTY
ncbi:PepSY domain-containing protein [Rheinheimera sp. EpRS3]|uniref:PepSY domain-containing protein n=1 Tax=Rheinheimera sp. EpRS3 TaxID=1712383 RepID=UPI00074B0D59|nr:PepSY domain-containing protein [Rheinheimera sp. EpRS3]KUM53688.1 nitric oxide synthase [Rheinheimera sp. EpRS3]